MKKPRDHPGLFCVLELYLASIVLDRLMRRDYLVKH
jgi:hypothetical protein